MAYGGFKDLRREQVQIKYSVKKHLILLKILKHDGCQRGLASMVCTFLDKKSF